MLVFSHISPSPEATEAIGLSVASLLRAGDVVGVEGDLGAGKTTLVRAVAKGLAIDPGLVSSPTFVMVNQYPIPPSRADTDPAPTTLAGGQLIHIDAYRLRGADDLDTLGWDRLFDAATGAAAGRSAAFIEWPQHIAAALPGTVARITIAAEGASKRRIAFSLPDEWLGRPGCELLRERPPIRCAKSGRWVPPTSPTYPFIDEKARNADLYGWLTGSYTTTRDPRREDEENV